METATPKDLAEPRRAKQPHQVALWLTVAYVILAALGMTGRLLLGESFVQASGILGWPGYWLAQTLGLGIGGSSLIMLICAFLAHYLAIYIPVKLWMTASRQLRIALIGCVVLGLTEYQLLKWYSTRIDWTSRGLNPNRPGFQPQVVVLAGTFDYWIKDAAINQTKRGKANFEIRMRGHDYYYCRKWRGTDWRVGSWFRVAIATNGTGYSWGLASLAHTTRGTGGTTSGNNLLAQRLWSGDQFVGADGDKLVAEDFKGPNRTEEFLKLVNVGPWSIPKRIRLIEGNERVENYYIKKIEFWPAPGTNWFGQVMSKYSDHKSEFRAKDLGEPGVAPGKRN